MTSEKLYQQILGLDSNWKVSSVDIDIEKSKISVKIDSIHKEKSCPISVVNDIYLNNF